MTPATYKVLVTVSKSALTHAGVGVAVHTLVVEFGTAAEADRAVEKVAAFGDKERPGDVGRNCEVWQDALRLD